MNFETSIKYLVAVLTKTKFSINVSEDNYIIDYFSKETKEATVKIILEYIKDSNTFCFKKEKDPINYWREFVTGDLSLVIKAIEKEYNGIVLWIHRNDEIWNNKSLKSKDTYFLYDILGKNPILLTKELKEHYQTIKNKLILNSKKMEKQKTLVNIDLISEKNENTLNLCLSALNQLTASMKDLILEEDTILRKSMSDTARVLADTIGSILLGAQRITTLESDQKPVMIVKKKEQPEKPIITNETKVIAKEEETPTMLYDKKEDIKKIFDPEIFTANIQERFHNVLDALAEANKPLEVPLEKANAIKLFIATSYPQNHEIRKDKTWVAKLYDMWYQQVVADIKKDLINDFNKDEVSDEEMAGIESDAATMEETTDESTGTATDDVSIDENTEEETIEEENVEDNTADIIDTKTQDVKIPENTKVTTATDFKKVETKTPATLVFTKLGSVNKEKNWEAIKTNLKSRYNATNIGEIGTFIKIEEKWVRVEIRNKTWGEGAPEGNTTIGSKDEISKRLGAIYDDIKKAS